MSSCGGSGTRCRRTRDRKCCVVSAYTFCLTMCGGELDHHWYILKMYRKIWLSFSSQIRTTRTVFEKDLFFSPDIFMVVLKEPVYHITRCLGQTIPWVKTIFRVLYFFGLYPIFFKLHPWKSDFGKRGEQPSLVYSFSRLKENHIQDTISTIYMRAAVEIMLKNGKGSAPSTINIYYPNKLNDDCIAYPHNQSH